MDVCILGALHREGSQGDLITCYTKIADEETGPGDNNCGDLCRENIEYPTFLLYAEKYISTNHSGEPEAWKLNSALHVFFPTPHLWRSFETAALKLRGGQIYERRKQTCLIFSIIIGRIKLGGGGLGKGGVRALEFDLP